MSREAPSTLLHRAYEVLLPTEYEDILAYHHMTERYEAIYQAAIEYVIGLSGGSGAYLDVGTATGKVPIELARLGLFEEIVGVDLSKEVLLFAARRAEQLGVKDRIKFVQGDANILPFPDGYFDVASCVHTLHHLPDPMKAVKELARVTKPNGSIFVIDFVRPPRWLRPFLIAFFPFGLGFNLRQQLKESLKAALSQEEWEDLMKKLAMRGSRLRRNFITHMSIERLKQRSHNTKLFYQSWAVRLARMFYFS